jgi:hypothetical protein
MTQFWLNDPIELLNLDLDSTNGILNLITLLVAVLTIVFSYSYGVDNIKYGIVTIMVILVVYHCNILEGFDAYDPRKTLSTEVEPVEIEDVPTICRLPTKDNPMANPELTDYGREFPYSGACNDDFSSNITSNIMRNGVFRDNPEAVFKQDNERIHVTPVTTVPNDQMRFANWCYNDQDNCKQGSIHFNDPAMANLTRCARTRPDAVTAAFLGPPGPREPPGLESNLQI